MPVSLQFHFNEQLSSRIRAGGFKIERTKPALKPETPRLSLTLTGVSESIEWLLRPCSSGVKPRLKVAEKKSCDFESFWYALENLSFDF